MVSGKKQVVWFHACFPASPAASQAACFYFSSIRTGLSCLCRNLSKTYAHWMLTGKIHSKAILSKTSTFPTPVPNKNTLKICQLNILLSAQCSNRTLALAKVLLRPSLCFLHTSCCSFAWSTCSWVTAEGSKVVSFSAPDLAAATSSEAFENT